MTIHEILATRLLPAVKFRWFDDLDRTHGARFPLSGYGLSATPFAP